MQKGMMKPLSSVKIDNSWKQTCLELNDGCGDTVVLLDNHSKLVVSDSSSGNGISCEIVPAE